MAQSRGWCRDHSVMDTATTQMPGTGARQGSRRNGRSARRAAARASSTQQRTSTCIVVMISNSNDGTCFWGCTISHLCPSALLRLALCSAGAHDANETRMKKRHTFWLHLSFLSCLATWPCLHQPASKNSSGAEWPKEQEWAPNAYVGVARLVASRSPEAAWEKGRHNSQPELRAQQLLERERVAPLVPTTTTTLCDSVNCCCYCCC